MRRITEFTGQELQWTRPSRRRRFYELRAGDEIVATLQWKKGSLAVAKVADGEWTFKRQGFWRRRVTVRREESEIDIAEFELGWSSGGTLDSGDGRRFRWAAANFWRSNWQWVTEDGTSLVHFDGKSKGTKLGSIMEIELAAVDLPQLPLLVMLGWYLLLMTAEEEAAATVMIN